MPRKELHFYMVRCDERDCEQIAFLIGDGQPAGWFVASLQGTDYVFCSEEHARSRVVRLAGVEVAWGSAPSFDPAAVLADLAK